MFSKDMIQYIQSTYFIKKTSLKNCVTTKAKVGFQCIFLGFLFITFVVVSIIAIFMTNIIQYGVIGAVHMSRASPANRADSILSRPMVA